MYDNRPCGAWPIVFCALLLATHATARAQARTSEVPAAKQQAPVTAALPHTHLLSAKLDLGVAFGGDEIPNRFVHAGEGVALGLGVASAPFWLSWLGFGGGVDFAFKYAATQTLTGGYSLSRWPLMLHVDVLARASPVTLIRIAGGPYLELGVEIARTGRDAHLDRKLPNAFGYLLEAGIRQRISRAFAFDASVRWTSLRYENSARSDAGGLGGAFAIHYVFF